MSIGVLVLGAVTASAMSSGARTVPRHRVGHATVSPVRSGVPASVGALFVDGAGGGHTCTASVVDSPSGDLVLTAAHCVSGSIAGARFVPGFTDGRAPYGSWIVERATVDPRWTDGQDPSADVAFLTVKASPTNATRSSVQAIVGANVLSLAPRAGDRIVVAGYRADADVPMRCAASTYETSGWPTFDCDGFATGTSGSPWIVDYDPTTGSGFVTGIIGGLEAGGDTDHTSYSPKFDNEVLDLARLAVARS